VSGALLLQRRLGDAEPLVREELVASRALKGDGHPDVLISLSTLIDCYVGQRKWVESEPLAREEVSIVRRHYGHAHPRALVAGHRLAHVLHAQGKEDKARTVQAEVLDGLMA